MRDDAVTDVLGSILLVGITVTMMVGLSFVVLNLPGPPDNVQADLAIETATGDGAWGNGDEIIRLRHLGGERLDGDVRLLVRIAGVETVIDATDQGFTDGSFRIGESWQMSTTIALGDRVEIGVLHDASNALVATADVVAGGGEASVVPPPGGGSVDNMPAISMVTGTVTNSANIAADDGSVTQFNEEAVGASQTVRLSPAAVSTDVSVVQEFRALTSDDNRARMNDAGDLLGVNGFDVPATATGITSVIIGIEAQYDGILTTDARLWYRIGGADGATDITETFNNGDDTFTVDVTADRPWSIADVESMEVRVQRSSGEFELEVDHLFIDITYVEGAGGDLEAVLDFTNAQTGAGAPVLELEFTAVTDTFHVEVWDWNLGSYTQRGSAMTAGSSATWSYTLEADEHDTGNTAVRVRLVDADGGVGPGRLDLDYARVVTP